MKSISISRLAIAVVGLGAAACNRGPGSSRRAESVLAEPLPTAADTIITPFGELPVAVSIGARKWVVVAADHNTVVVADFATKQFAPLGGPAQKELQHPFGAFVGGDTIYVADWGTRRTSLWTKDGRLVGTIPAPAATRGIQPAARDAAGQFYFEVPPMAGADGSGNKDSISVVRSDPSMTKFDTVARLSPVEIAEVQRNTGKRFERLINGGRDQWGVRPNGRVWIARVFQNRVNTIGAGKEHPGEDLPDPVLEMTQADRDQFIQSFPEDVRSTIEDVPFALIKPPFEKGFQDPIGNVWLRKSRGFADSIRRYHVVDSTGLLARVFEALGRGVVNAAGTETVLMEEQFKAGVRLMEVRIPSRRP
ncbi:MAG: hypothetical protein ABI647_00840 [Gemmatimonadota bacterium]